MSKSIRPFRRSILNRTEPYYKDIKPGTLARLRDSRMSARSLLVSAQSQIRIHRDSSPPASPPSDGSDTYFNVIDGVSFLVPRAYGPRYPHRKKIFATKSLWKHSTIPASPTASPSVSVVDVFGSDVVAA